MRSMYIWWIVGLYVIELSNNHHVSSTQFDPCKYTQRDDAPEVYFVNMDNSKDRRISTENHLREIGLLGYRVRGLTPKEIYIPLDIESTWRTAKCKLMTDWQPPFENNQLEMYGNYTAYTASLCGRGKKKNTPKELGCTTSHLIAMYNAIYSPSAKSRYAIIIEDDVYFPFDVDFSELVKSAPSDFGILQLFNSNEGSMINTWKRYVSNPKALWILRHPIKYLDFWSTCAYLIDRVVMKPVIDAVVNITNANNRKWIALKIVAGLNNPCVPYECCKNGTDNFELKPPCVWAPRGYQADSFLYSMTKTYMLSFPIITNGKGGNKSTFHQDHVAMFHKRSFRKQRELINQMLSGTVKPPSFAKPACKDLLDENEPKLIKMNKMLHLFKSCHHQLTHLTALLHDF
eukprot:gene17215-23726_t